MTSPYPEPSKGTFLFLSLLAAGLMFGSLTINGGLKQILLTMWNGTFSDGSTLYNVYTGLPFLDFALSLTPVFWTPAFARYSSLKLLSATLYPALHALSVWGTVEVLRGGSKPLFLRWAPAMICLCMYAGTALFVPFYCYYDLVRHFASQTHNASSGNANVHFSRAVWVLPATVACTVWRMTSSQHQTLLALNIFGSIFCYVQILAGAQLVSSQSPMGSRYFMSDKFWIKATYASMALYCLLAHLAVIGHIARSHYPTISISSVFVPDFIVGLSGSPASLGLNLAPEVLFFLQWDFLIFNFSVSVWATRICEAMYCKRVGGWDPLSRMALLLAFTVAGMLFNPGAIASVLLCFREEFIRLLHKTINQKIRW